MPNTFDTIFKYNKRHSKKDGRFTNADDASASDSDAPKLPIEKMGNSIREPDGGFTINPITGEQPSEGYALSIHPDRSLLLDGGEKLSDAQLSKVISDYTSKNKDLFKNPENYIGAWHDPDTHKVWMDVSTIVSSPEKAFKMGNDHDQIAYFDLKSMKSVTIDTNAQSGQGTTKSEVLMDAKTRASLEAQVAALRKQRESAKGIPEARLLWQKLKPLLAQLGQLPK